MGAIITEGCIGCGICAETCPEVFEMGSDGLAVVKGQVTDQNRELAETAAADCPVSVITVG